MTIDDIMANHKGHFFDDATLDLFKSEILNDVYEGPGGVFFITSERYPGEGRHFKVRQFYPDTGGITTALGHSKGMVTKAQAATAAAG